jgi:H+/Cl- antiporter ClcA
MKLLSILWDRFTAKTPLFWRNVQKVLLALSFASGVGFSQIEQLPKWNWLEEYLRIGMFCGLFGTFLAQLTKENTEENKS